MQVRLKPCAKRGNINHRACTNEGCSLFLYRAQPVSEMERSGVELQGQGMILEILTEILTGKKLILTKITIDIII